ncbi:MAG: gamma-glutamylcyclotransferase [Gammaproteobacteria bacterium]
MSDDELRPAWQTMLGHATDTKDLWVFAYGSLIWKPEVEPDESIRATLQGYHRRFCLWQWRSRGSPTTPGVMMALEHGGSCVSVAQRYVGTDAAERVWPTWRREMRGAGYVARWVNVQTERGPINALTFTVNRNSVRYARNLSVNRAGRAIAKASGSRGPSAEYLLNTLAALEHWGIEDRGLLSLEEHVVKALDE